MTAAPVMAQDVRLRGVYEWVAQDAAFGGFSGLEMKANGTGFYALSDRGHLATGRLERTDGQITGVTLTDFVKLVGQGGVPLLHEESDAEGLALTDDGRLFISFEWVHGLRELRNASGETGPLIATPAFNTMSDNASLEAVAVGSNGVLYTIPERSGLATRPFPVFRYADGQWDVAFDIPRRGVFLVVGADIGPDGRLYVLERDFIAIGFRSRVRSFAMDGRDERLILETGLRTHDNLEGISLWQDGDVTVMTLISDDNFRGLQRTEIVEYELTQD